MKHLSLHIYCLLFLTLFTFASLNTVFLFSAPALAQTCSPTLLGSYDRANSGIFVLGSTAYVAAGDLHIINVSDPTNPTLLGIYDILPGSAKSVFVLGSTAYVAVYGGGSLQIINVSDPAAPTLLGSYDTPGSEHAYYDVYVSGSTAYVADYYNGLRIINVSDPTNPTLLGSYAMPSNGAYDVYVSGTTAYVVDLWHTDLHIVDVTDPTNPTLLSIYDTPDTAYGVYVSGSTAYVADNSSLQIINVTDPTNPTLLGSYPAYSWDVYVSGSTAYVASGSFSAFDFQIINVSDPTNPTLLGSNNRLPGYSEHVFVLGSTAYVGGNRYGAGLHMINVNGCGLEESSTPVVLVHGWCGDPSKFGEMATLLDSDAGLTVADPFDYSFLTQVPSQGDLGVSIEELADFLGVHINQVINNDPNGATQVDVVAHSMGGLIVRAWMAGMSDWPFPAVPYEGQIRKLILIGTPNYGVEDKSLWHIALKTFNKLGINCSETQGMQMLFGSEFIWSLHDAWENFKQKSPHSIATENLLFIVGTNGDNDIWECHDPQGCTDQMVSISSAVLPDSPNETIRYVPFVHSYINPRGLRPTHKKIAFVTDGSHKTYQLVKEFLGNGNVLGQCCGEDTVDYNPPHIRGVQEKQEGLLLLRMLDSATQQPATAKNAKVKNLDPSADFKQDYNRDGGSITAWGIEAPQDYDLEVTVRSFNAPNLQDIQINVARPTVPQPVEVD